MEKYFNGAALLLVAAGLFTLSYVIYLQEDRGRWVPISHDSNRSIVMDSYNGRVWDMSYEDDRVYELQIVDPTMGRIKGIIPSKKE